MTSQKKIEEKLEKLAKAIAPDEKLVANVMSRIDAIPIAAPKENEKLNTKLILRRLIMNRYTKYAAAAVILITALIVWSRIPYTVVPTAYALQDTIEAYNSIRYLHIKVYKTNGQERKTSSEVWINCDDYGQMKKVRFQAPSVGEPVGPLVIVGDSNSSQAWLEKFNLLLVGYRNPSGLLRFEVSTIDPKSLFERLYEQEKQGEIILDVNEPRDKAKPIIITVTYPEASLSEAYKKLLYVDQATRLVKKIEKFKIIEGQYQYLHAVEFCDYNQEIDPMMFNLEGELPEDVTKIDMTDADIGLNQANMSRQEVATEVVRKFFEAVIAKDYSKAGLLYLGAPGLVIEQAFMGANVNEIISIGQAHADHDPDSNKMITSCKVLFELNGKKFELDATNINVLRLRTQPDRWVISGMTVSAKPAAENQTN